jgi:ketosteroid isomerase-like protein
MRTMKTVGLLACVVWLAGCTVYGQKPVKALADATGGEGLEQALWRDIQHKDWKDLQNHTASIFVYQTPNGKLDRAAALERIQKMDVSEYSLGELSTELHGNVFVVTYSITLRGTLDGQPLPDKAERRMSVWQQQKSGWMLIAHAVIGMT